MTSTSAKYAAWSGTNIVHRGAAAAGTYMITLCRLSEPISIRPPQSPHLKPFTFFTSRAREPDGSEPLYLHMGFFETLTNAERWAQAVRGRHPGAMATMAPPQFRQLPVAAIDQVLLTDTQVLNILETRGPASGGNGDERGSEQIELLRPDDTVTRRALKEAVVEGAPVSFAVQLHWSSRPIDLDRVPTLPMLRAYTLYAVESRRASRSCFFLRLGFFEDPVSAKQVAAELRSSFASAAVVPVLDEEIARAREACTDTSPIPCLVQHRLDPALATGAPDGGATSKPGAETIEQTLARLAQRELWSDPDFLSDTGVRHLKVEVEERTSSSRH
ncbi:MAG TPA: hypothetical protein VJ738_17195 [Steroidobacteraceae bacterium]|nr:hypothetical protein [Steroidobacteraceae bacterium]